MGFYEKPDGIIHDTTARSLGRYAIQEPQGVARQRDVDALMCAHTHIDSLHTIDVCVKQAEPRERD
jgi:hypothetical protein